MTRFVVLPGLDGTGELLREFSAALSVLGEVTVPRYRGDRRPRQSRAPRTPALSDLAA
ncbi:MAG TPA: hypothetical protein VLF18_01540 [Tahibacter sp.]|uniref:hypothetical protein n=1 Tax=Tahibacter sp. TaxID=2056211 RepID=UPI002BC71131|nr:hypothetical protein [Tahibacter sp.]HSX58857.1 hypothetical protein [Tahibacter sp.]